VTRLRVVRPWISRSGPRAQRQTTLVFRLSRPALIELVFTRIAPDCRVVGKLRVQGRAGLNRVQFRGRIGRRILRPGMYRVTARTLRPRRAAPVRVNVIIVGRPNPTPAVIALARATNACAHAAGEPDVTAAAAAPLGTAPPSSPRPKPTVLRVRDVLGTQFTRAADLVREVPPFLFPVLAFAIVLLGLATIPRRVAPTLRLQALLAYHREWIVLAGTITLISVAVTYAVW
jgi:hypothetical protein